MIGKDPRPYEAHVALLRGLRRAALTGAFAQAIGALENALIDLKARALGIPVYALFGGPIRERLPLYWSHCGTWRVGPQGRANGAPPVRTLDDVVALGREVPHRARPRCPDDGPPRLCWPFSPSGAIRWESRA